MAALLGNTRPHTAQTIGSLEAALPLRYDRLWLVVEAEGAAEGGAGAGGGAATTAAAAAAAMSKEAAKAAIS